MGRTNKLLLEVNGSPLVRRVAETALAARLDPVVVVLGHEAEAIRHALDGLKLSFAVNAHPEEGMGSSIRVGLAALESMTPTVQSALFMLGDMPWVQPADVEALVTFFDPADGRGICVPTYRGQRGNPVLWGSRFFPEMAELRGDVGARAFLARHPESVCEVEVDSRGVLRDVDTFEALEDAQNAHPPGD